ncbi:hypothetical protein SKAU_G00303300 [Synaphobranchus kaupii]|uniref:Uncharacterized protein n=1 Tax=Synaphobranchus kaupii TaxID=118154 RepID=A0A9Q1IMI5_SYNKA|nr:hypothetical protein SKAU_G00303300 [Synaphobranchus kaupii]
MSRYGNECRGEKLRVRTSVPQRSAVYPTGRDDLPRTPPEPGVGEGGTQRTCSLQKLLIIFAGVNLST